MFDHGGHFVSLEVPDLYTVDGRKFLRSLR